MMSKNKDKLSIPSLKKLIKETRRDALDRAYKKKFVENFEDVRENLLSEERLDSMAEHLYELIFKDKS
jgi:hypothetical protein